MHASDAAVFAKQALRSLWMRLAYGCSPRHLRLQVEPLVFHFNVSLESAAAQLDMPIALQHGQSAALVAPQLAALAAWGARLRVWAALRTLEEHLRRFSTVAAYGAAVKPVPGSLIPRPLIM